MKQYKKLFESFNLNGFNLKNRFVLSPMTLSFADQNGNVTDQELAYANRRKNSASLQITGGVYFDQFGQLFKYGISAATDDHIDSLKQLYQAMKTDSNCVVLQLAHAGKFSKASLKKYGYLYGPSYEKNHFPVDHEVFELTETQIQEIIQSYADASLRAIKAGFDGIEISMAQRLLIQTFFSQHVNKRTDRYSSDNFENRSRLCLEIFTKVRQIIDQYAPKNFILGFRATPEETYGAVLGYSIIDFFQLVDLLIEKTKISYLAIASWGHDIYLNKIRSDCQFKNQLTNKVIYQKYQNKLPIISSGGINSPDKCLEALKYCDLIGLSSVFVADPEFVEKIRTNRLAEINLAVKSEQLTDLCIPKSSFKDIVNMFSYCQTIPDQTIKTFKDNLKK
ncbi:NADH-dependent flavin oxidoreductase [Mycoplasma putrefaciens]|uniref:NADH dependent flavin oxidoreductase n=1 Tax=Mycoplasma putrefaciens Mput9231 TaxID=1292033 RepID=M9WE20_9MOLU|nr:NADH-dependent flavin oxidoreductase [Mycoplasma putrefaciens]AGJ91021.1 NADH dependent flavin oxidoreductase [Mycoplasma putrefaciens Mput9231]